MKPTLLECGFRFLVFESFVLEFFELFFCFWERVPCDEHILHMQQNLNECNDLPVITAFASYANILEFTALCHTCQS